MRQGFDGYTSDDSWTRYRPSTESGIIKYKAFKRAVQARKAQQVQEKQQQKEEAIQTVAKYQVDSINNAKTVHDILAIQQWMTVMEDMVQQV